MRPVAVVCPSGASTAVPGHVTSTQPPWRHPLKKLLILVVVLALGAFAAKKLLED
jgi:hypothetical protein